MYATLLVMLFSAAAALPANSISKECMEDIQQKYAQHLALSPEDADDHAAIMEKVIEQIDFTKCLNVQFRIDFDHSEKLKSNNNNVSKKQLRQPDARRQPKFVYVSDDDSEKIENSRDEVNEDKDMYLLNVKDHKDEEANNRTNNHQKFDYDQKESDAEEAQQSYITNDEINQYDDEDEYENIDDKNTYNYEKQTNNKDDEENVQAINKYDRRYFDNRRFRQQHDPQYRPNYYTTRQPDDTQQEPNDKHYNTKRPRYKHGESNVNYYIDKQQYDTQSEPNANYYSTRQPYVPYDRESLDYGNVRQTGAAQGSTDKFVNTEDSGEYSNENDYESKEAAEVTAKTEVDKTNAYNEQKNEYASLQNYMETTTINHYYPDYDNDSKHDVTYIDDTKTKSTNQSTDGYNNQDEMNSNNYNERPIDDDFHTLSDGKSSYSENESGQIDRYEKETEKSIDNVAETNNNKGIMNKDIYPDQIEESNSEEVLMKRNPQESKNDVERQIIYQSTTKSVDFSNNIAASHEATTKVYLGENKGIDNETQKPYTDLNKLNMDHDKSKDTSLYTDESVTNGIYDSNENQLETSTVYLVTKLADVSTTEAMSEYASTSPSSNQGGKIGEFLVQLEHSEKKDLISNIDQSDAPNLEGPQKVDINSKELQNNKQMGNNPVQIQDNHKVKTEDQNVVPEFSSQSWLIGNSNQNWNILKVFEDLSENGFLACPIKVFYKIYESMSSLLKFLRSFFGAGG